MTHTNIPEVHEIIAYELYSQTDMPIHPAAIQRPWMEATQNRFAYRCLPLSMANQAGWLIDCPSSFTARWDGSPGPAGVTIVHDVAPPDNRVSPLFGHGTITFHVPYLFRSSDGVNLWVKGPSNHIKHGVQALEGLVETDWTAATFTMNWKLTQPGSMVRFERGEPICMIVPYPRHYLEGFAAVRKPLSEDESLLMAYQNWSRERDEFQKRIAENEPIAIRRGWQKDYFQGRDPGGERFADHQTKISVCPFHRG